VNWRLVSGLLGVAATLFGVASLFLPSLRGLWSGQQGRIDPATDAMAFVWLAVVVAAVAVLVVRANVRESRELSDSPAVDRFAGQPSATADGTRVAADPLDADLRGAVRRGGEQLLTVRSLLRATAVDAYAEANDVSTARAQRAVERGAWTDDGVAARFLGSEAGLSLWRLRLWLVPVRERQRRIERTIGAIERLQEKR
jgi:hypothetical protein